MERRGDGRDRLSPLALLRLGIHPASQAWLIRERDPSDEHTCFGCIFYVRVKAQARCTHPGNLPGEARTFPSWPACVLWHESPDARGNFATPEPQ